MRSRAGRGLWTACENVGFRRRVCVHHDCDQLSAAEELTRGDSVKCGVRRRELEDLGCGRAVPGSRVQQAWVCTVHG